MLCLIYLPILSGMANVSGTRHADPGVSLASYKFGNMLLTSKQFAQLRDEAARAQQQFGQFDGAKDAAARAAQDARAREAQVAQMAQCVLTTICACPHVAAYRLWKGCTRFSSRPCVGHAVPGNS